MLALLVGVGVLLLYAIAHPELGFDFSRPEGFYDNMPEKIGAALLFAVVVGVVARLLGKGSR